MINILLDLHETAIQPPKYWSQKIISSGKLNSMKIISLIIVIYMFGLIPANALKNLAFPSILLCETV
jgi:hypothetical protein